MTKRAKAFSKIFKAGEVTRSLLESEMDDQSPGRSDTVDGFDDDDDDDDFPLEPTQHATAKGNFDDSGDIFAAPRKSSNRDFPSPANAAFDGSFHGNEFALDDTAAFGEFDDMDGSGGFAGFPKDTAGDWDGNDGDIVEEVDSEFQASFSAFEEPVKDIQESTSPRKSANVKRRLTKLFMKKEDKMDQPVARCAEIVVDKSKIPTTKVELTLVGGMLVAKKDPQPEEDEPKEKSGASRLKAITKSLIMKVGATKERLEDDSTKQDLADSSETKDNSDGAEFDAKDQEAPDETEDSEALEESSKRHSQGNRSAIPSETQRRRRRESRMDIKAGAVSRLSGQKMRETSKSDGRVRRTRTAEDAVSMDESKPRRSRTSDGSGAGGGRRRQTLLEKHSGAPLSPQTSTGRKVAGDGGLDESSRPRASRREKGELVDESSRRGGRREREDMLDGSSMRASRRDVNARRESKRPIRKTLSGDRSDDIRRKGDGLSATSHAPTTYRRAQTEGSMAFRRAQSTRRLGNNDLLAESAHKNGVLSDRERLRRATMNGSEQKGEKNVSSKKKALSSLYGGGGSRPSAQKDEPDDGLPKPRRRLGSDGGVLEEKIDEDEEDEEELEGAIEEEDENETDDEEEIDESRTSVGDILAAEHLNASDVENLIRVVMRRAESATHPEEVEAIVKATLHQSIADFDHMIDEELDSPVDSQFGDGSRKTKGGLSRKDLEACARDYVTNFLTAKGGLEGVDDDFHEADSRPPIDFGGVVSTLAQMDIKYEPSRDGTGRGAKNLSRVREDVLKKMELVKAKAFEKKSPRTGRKQVASRIEAKAEAKTKSRVRNPVAVAK